MERLYYHLKLNKCAYAEIKNYYYIKSKKDRLYYEYNLPNVLTAPFVNCKLKSRTKL